MTTLRYRPAGPLGFFVETIWYYDGYTQPHSLERLMPDGALSFVVNLADDFVRVYDRRDPSRFTRLSGAVAVGAHDEFFVIDTAEQRSVLGVQFRPGGAYPFLDVPCDALRGEHVSIEGSLRERILEAPTPQAKCRAMENILLERARGRLEIRPDIAAALRELPALTSKHFTERFRRTVGLTPKTYSRVRRFQSALRQIGDGGAVDWTEIALSCGYYDQAHFNHDFRAFSGISPTTYLALKTPHPNHVPI